MNFFGENTKYTGKYYATRVIANTDDTELIITVLQCFHLFSNVVKMSHGKLLRVASCACWVVLLLKVTWYIATLLPINNNSLHYSVMY